MFLNTIVSKNNMMNFTDICNNNYIIRIINTNYIEIVLYSPSA